MFLAGPVLISDVQYLNLAHDMFPLSRTYVVMHVAAFLQAPSTGASQGRIYWPILHKKISPSAPPFLLDSRGGSRLSVPDGPGLVALPRVYQVNTKQLAAWWNQTSARRSTAIFGTMQQQSLVRACGAGVVTAVAGTMSSTCSQPSAGTALQNARFSEINLGEPSRYKAQRLLLRCTAHRGKVAYILSAAVRMGRSQSEIKMA